MIRIHRSIYYILVSVEANEETKRFMVIEIWRMLNIVLKNKVAI